MGIGNIGVGSATPTRKAGQPAERLARDLEIVGAHLMAEPARARVDHHGDRAFVEPERLRRRNVPAEPLDRPATACEAQLSCPLRSRQQLVDTIGEPRGECGRGSSLLPNKSVSGNTQTDEQGGEDRSSRGESKFVPAREFAESVESARRA